MITNLQEYTVRGLTHEEVERRLAMEGYNELPSSRPRNLFQIALGVLKEPMFILLVVCDIGGSSGRPDAAEFCLCHHGDRILSGKEDGESTRCIEKYGKSTSIGNT